MMNAPFKRPVPLAHFAGLTAHEEAWGDISISVEADDEHPNGQSITLSAEQFYALWSAKWSPEWRRQA